MFNEVKKVAGASLATSVVLVSMANNARAYDFAFTDFSSPSGSAEGTVTIRDSAIPGALTQADFIAWEIDVFNPSNVFESQLTEANSIIDIFNSASATSSKLSIQPDFIIISPTSGEGIERAASGSGVYIDYGASFNTDGGEWNISAAATPVPFGVSTDLSLLVLGSLYGASRLHKKLASK